MAIRALDFNWLGSLTVLFQFQLNGTRSLLHARHQWYLHFLDLPNFADVLHFHMLHYSV